MIYCNNCKHEIELHNIYYSPPDKSVGERADADFRCCSGDNVWYIPDYYIQEDPEPFSYIDEIFRLGEREIQQHFLDWKRVDAWEALRILTA